MKADGQKKVGRTAAARTSPPSKTQLQESHDRLQAILDALFDFLFVVDRAGRIHDFHSPRPELLYAPPENFIGRKVSEVLPPDAANVIRHAIATTVKQGRTQGHVYSLPYPSGTRWFELSVTTQGDLRKPAGRFVLIVRDITGRMQAEEALRQSESKYRYLHETMRDAFVTADMKGRLREFNPAFLDLLGHAGDELREMTYKDITPRRWHARESKIVKEQVLARGYSDVYEKEYLRKDGTVVPVELRTILIRDAAGQATGMWASVRNATERKRAELALQQANDDLERRVAERTADLEASRQALAKSEEQFRQMAGSIDEAFWLIDAKTWKVLYVSPAFERIWKRPMSDFHFEAARWVDSIHPEDRERVRKAFQQGMKTGIPGTVAFRVAWPDSSVRWIEASASMIRDGKGRPLRAVGVLRDITDRRMLEEKILRASETERQRIGRDLHDSLGQSLTAIGYLAEAVRGNLARQRRPEAKEVQKLETLIRQAASQSHAMARELLLADLKRGGLPTALHELAFRIRELYGVACRYVGPAALPLGMEIASQLHLIAQEAASNAAKHSRAKRIEIQLTHKRNRLLLSVRDTGKGIPSKKSNGDGMGLDIMRYRAGMIGATLTIAARRGRGTTVNCLVPHTPPPPRVRKRRHENSARIG